jgi:hypothetical protein
MGDVLPGNVSGGKPKAPGKVSRRNMSHSVVENNHIEHSGLGWVSFFIQEFRNSLCRRGSFAGGTHAALAQKTACLVDAFFDNRGSSPLQVTNAHT